MIRTEAQKAELAATGWISGPPGWFDNDQRVEVVCDEGQTLVGRLFAGDTADDGDGDEYPLWFLEQDDGTEVEYLCIEKWRPVDAPPPATPAPP